MVTGAPAQEMGPERLREMLARTAEIARAAGARILEHYRDGVAVERKADASPITAADRAAHEAIVAGLRAIDPGAPIVSEEGEVPPPETRCAWRRFWLVDPLDGTKEFISKNGEFTVNLALIENGVPVLGVVFAPALEVLYRAARGLGAWKEEARRPAERIFSRRARRTEPLVVVESRSHPSPALEEFLRTIRVARRVPAGSSLKFCLVAEGKADVYPRFGPTMEWDVAAGDCVWRNSAHVGERRSPLTYGKPDLRNGDFVIGLDDEDPAPGGAGGAGGAVVWLTGLPGSGKSTIAARLAAALAERGVPHELLDGDEIRAVFPQTGFSREERDAHVRRVGFIASKLEKHGVVAIVSLVSPYAASREAVRRMCRRFVEVHVATPLAECERRDPKGLYAKARRGEIVAFTGVSDPYEPPGRPEIAIDGGAASAEEAALLILNRLLNPAPVPREGRTGGAASP